MHHLTRLPRSVTHYYLITDRRRAVMKAVYIALMAVGIYLSPTLYAQTACQQQCFQGCYDQHTQAYDQCNADYNRCSQNPSQWPYCQSDLNTCLYQIGQTETSCEDGCNQSCAGEAMNMYPSGTHLGSHIKSCASQTNRSIPRIRDFTDMIYVDLKS